MKLSTTTTEKKEIEISLPYFGKATSGGEYFAILGEGNYLNICNWQYSDHASIYTHSTSQYVLDNHVEITKEEFIAAYEKAQQRINESFIKSCGFTPEYDPIRALVGDGEE